MRCRRGKIIYLGQHLRRLSASCRSAGLNLHYGSKELEQKIQVTARIQGGNDLRVKLMLRAGACTINVQAYQPYRPVKYKQGFRVCVSNLRQNEHSALARLKSTRRELYERAYKQAKSQGFDEALLLNRRGDLAEATRSNIFFIRGKKLYTPSLACGCLPGITRKAVMDLAAAAGIRVSAGRFSVDELLKSDEAFLTNALIGIMPLTAVEGKRIGKKRWPGITRSLRREYNCLLK